MEHIDCGPSSQGSEIILEEGAESVRAGANGWLQGSLRDTAG